MPTTRINLEYPITHNAQTISELTLRRPTVGDNLAAQKAGASDTESGVTTRSRASRYGVGRHDAKREIRLIANLSEVAPEVVHLLDMKDYGKMQQVLAGFCRDARLRCRNAGTSGRSDHGAGPAHSLATL